MSRRSQTPCHWGAPDPGQCRSFRSASRRAARRARARRPGPGPASYPGPAAGGGGWPTGPLPAVPSRPRQRGRPPTEGHLMKIIRTTLALASAPALAAAFIVLSAGAASASPVPSIASSTVHHAGSCTASGDFAICDAAGNAWHPFRIRVHVHASPDQHVSVSWLTVCTRGSGAGSRSGSFTAVTPINRLIRHPYWHPRSCTISSVAQLQDGGHWIALWNTYRRW
jgi:hypothetical protein